jgi:conjugal transfer pilus assembly protein TraF
MKRLALMSLLLGSGVSAPFYQDQARGWHWYEMKPKPKPPQRKDSVSVPLTATQRMQQYRKRIEEALNEAILHPTPSNLLQYQRLQQELMNRAQTFSQTWMETVWSHPELDDTLKFPVNQKARHLYLDQEKKQTNQAIAALKKEWGLFFFFSSQCPYCVQFAPIVKQFAQIYDFEVIPISKDGSSLPEFPHPKLDPGILEAWGINFYPALFGVNPKTEEVVPIAFGFVSLDEIEKRIHTLTQRQKKETP